MEKFLRLRFTFTFHVHALRLRLRLCFTLTLHAYVWPLLGLGGVGYSRVGTNIVRRVVVLSSGIVYTFFLILWMFKCFRSTYCGVTPPLKLYLWGPQGSR